jgi:hypothetical protein
MKKTILVLISLFSCVAGKSQEVVSGCYASNFAIIGWFAAEITFNEDQSFEYLFAGDLYYDKIGGKYELIDHQIHLKYEEIRDTLEIPYTDSLGNLKLISLVKPVNNASGFRPSKLRIKKDKLIVFDQDGKRIRRKMNANERWQKYFFVKHPCEEDAWIPYEK